VSAIARVPDAAELLDGAQHVKHGSGASHAVESEIAAPGKREHAVPAERAQLRRLEVVDRDVMLMPAGRPAS
jgi:hypothetical protein